jgi:porin
MANLSVIVIAVGLATIIPLSATFAQSGQTPPVQGVPAPTQDVWHANTLTGNWGGLRDRLKDRGVEFTINETAEMFGAAKGGIERSPTFESLLEVTTDADLQKLLGWTGATTHVTVFSVTDSGNKNALNLTGSLSDPSNIDAVPTLRLYQAYIEQYIVPKKLTVRAGQIAADGDFKVKPSAAGLMNGTFGWPTAESSNIPSGGPAFPLATPGVRIEAKLTEQFSVKAAVYSGNPAGSNCTADPQICDRYGLKFSTSGGALAFGELHYAMAEADSPIGLPGVLKLGGWYLSADAADRHYGFSSGGAIVPRSLAASPITHRGDYGVYGLADQTIWRQGKASISAFGMAEFAPKDRNPVSFYVDGGVALKGYLPRRPEDVLSFGVAYSRISSDAIAGDRDSAMMAGLPQPIRDAETVFEVSYVATIAPWWTIQPDLQYFIHPGGNVPLPSMPEKAIPNTLVVGLRTQIKF